MVEVQFCVQSKSAGSKPYPEETIHASGRFAYLSAMFCCGCTPVWVGVSQCGRLCPSVGGCAPVYVICVIFVERIFELTF